MAMFLNQKKICFVVNSASFFLSHRAVIAKELLRKGAEVHVITAPGDGVEDILKLGAKHHSAKINRSGKNIVRELFLFYKLVRLLSEIKPDLVHLVTIKPMLYGGLASKILGIHCVVSAISGLGHVFSAQTKKMKLLKFFLTPLFKLAFRAEKSRVIFQNTSDRDVLLGMGVVTVDKVRMIKGSGIDLELYKPALNKANILTITFAARLLKNKGIHEFFDVAKIIKDEYPAVRFVVIGELDPDNPLSITDVELECWKKLDVVDFLGFKTDIQNFLAQSDIFVFPSYYGEGVPKVLLEAAACGCPIVTTDHPGCRDAVIDGVTGLLVPIKDKTALAKAIKKLMRSKILRKKFSIAARNYAEEEFDVKYVVEKHLDIYKEII